MTLSKLTAFLHRAGEQMAPPVAIIIEAKIVAVAILARRIHVRFPIGGEVSTQIIGQW